jgi:predicted transcriptional regulator
MLKQEFLLRNLTDKRFFQGQRRGHFEIVMKILALCMKGKLKTKILYEANLSFVLAERYINGLKLHGLIRQEGEKYFTTEKGKHALDLFSELNEAISGSR